MSYSKERNIIKAGTIGDSLGYNIEFKTIEEINKLYTNGISFSQCDNYIVSDDTQMTLFCLEALKENHFENYNNEAILKMIYEYYLDWNATQYRSILFKKEFSKQNQLHKKQAPGITCLTALGSKRCGTMIMKINNSKGCGGIMRVAPIAFLNRDLEDIIYLGCMQAAITHGHPEGYLSSGFLAGLIHLGIKGFDFNRSYIKVKELIKDYKDSDSFINYLNEKEKFFDLKFANPNEMIQSLGNGWTGESALVLSIYAFKKATNFKEAIYISVNHSGDSDSTGSICGQLYASFNNLNEIDLDIFKKVDLYSLIENSLVDIEKINNFKTLEEKNEKSVEKKNLISIIKNFFKDH